MLLLRLLSFYTHALASYSKLMKRKKNEKKSHDEGGTVFLSNKNKILNLKKKEKKEGMEHTENE